jgi:LPXTG-motif cell wall-anchored protein
MSKLEFPVFALFAWGGAAVWLSTFLSIGYFLGDKWEMAAENAHVILMYVAGAAVIAGIGYYFYRRRKTVN